MKLKSNQTRHLRGLAHALHPVVTVGNKGITDALLAELEIALEKHELVKIKISAEDRAARDACIARIAEQSQSVLVQRIGHIACLYRRNAEEPRIVLPK